jgi:Ser/Thr protein kinase RdoA (MazF antagonist)
VLTELPHASARPSADDPRLEPLLRRIGHTASQPPADLGGTMSLNLHLPERQAVLRVHHPTESRARILGLRRLRRRLADAGQVVSVPLEFDGRELVRWEGHWVQLETYVGHSVPAQTWDSYVWMYESIGQLHRVLRELDAGTVPRPAVATYGPPGSLRRWLAITRSAVTGNPTGEELCAWASELVRRLERQWQSASGLPVHLVHGDIRLGNAVLTTGGERGYLDFGFAAARPRVHELADSLAWIVLRPDSSGTGAGFLWDRVGELIGAYEEAAGVRLSTTERAALGPYLAAVPLYLAAISGYTADATGHLVENTPFIRIAEWVLDHPDRI